jgi:hypothetical protein
MICPRVVASLSVSLACVAMASWLQAPTHAADFFVDPPAAGQADETLAAALAQAGPGDRVLLRAGEYRLREPVRFPRGGREGSPLTLCAVPGQYVALLGSLRLTGWQQHAGRIWKVAHPPKPVKGLYEDGERLTHPRPDWGRREDPPLSELKTPGTWTQDDQWIYLWSRAGDSPDNHRIEASQNIVIDVNQPWVHVQGLHLLFGQHVVCQISADHCEVRDCEIAHCSNSVDNSYNAYLSGCSHSAFRNCLIHDSFYWGDHGSNSHTLSTINCGDHGPNFVAGCEIFNGGLGVGTKGAVRELVVTGCRIYDQVNGITTSGERSAGPGAGKRDRGHYLIWQNHITDCDRGVWISSGKTHENRIWGNLFTRCGAAFSMRDIGTVPDRPHVANNVFLDNAAAVYLLAGRDGTEKISTFVEAGFRSHHNLFFGNRVDWQSPLTWSSSLDLTLAQIHDFQDLGLEAGSLAAQPLLDQFGRSRPGCPALDSGAELPLPEYVEQPGGWHIGLGPQGADPQRPELGLTLSIAGSATSVGPAEPVRLQAVLRNEFPDRAVELSGQRDLILTFHFRYCGGHRDKQELFRCRVQLPETRLEPGESLDVTTLPGWTAPVNGRLGDAFHLRTDTDQWRRGCRLRATARFVARDQPTAQALQQLSDLIRSKEVLPVELH